MTLYQIKHQNTTAPVKVERRVYKSFIRDLCVRNGTRFRVHTAYANACAIKTLMVLP